MAGRGSTALVEYIEGSHARFNCTQPAGVLETRGLETLPLAGPHSRWPRRLRRRPRARGRPQPGSRGGRDRLGGTHPSRGPRGRRRRRGDDSDRCAGEDRRGLRGAGSRARRAHMALERVARLRVAGPCARGRAGERRAGHAGGPQRGVGIDRGRASRRARGRRGGPRQSGGRLGACRGGHLSDRDRGGAACARCVRRGGRGERAVHPRRHWSQRGAPRHDVVTALRVPLIAAQRARARGPRPGVRLRRRRSPGLPGRTTVGGGPRDRVVQGDCPRGGAVAGGRLGRSARAARRLAVGRADYSRGCRDGLAGGHCTAALRVGRLLRSRATRCVAQAALRRRRASFARRHLRGLGGVRAHHAISGGDRPGPSGAGHRPCAGVHRSQEARRDSATRRAGAQALDRAGGSDGDHGADRDLHHRVRLR